MYVAFESVLMRWMNLEPVIQSEVSQREKEISYVNAYIYGLQKNGTDEPTCWAETGMQTQLIDLWKQQGMKGEGQIERVALTYIHYHV